MCFYNCCHVVDIYWYVLSPFFTPVIGTKERTWQSYRVCLTFQITRTNITTKTSQDSKKIVHLVSNNIAREAQKIKGVILQLLMIKTKHVLVYTKYCLFFFQRKCSPPSKIVYPHVVCFPLCFLSCILLYLIFSSNIILFSI